MRGAIDAGVNRPTAGWSVYVKEEFGIDICPAHFSQLKPLGMNTAASVATNGKAHVAPSANGHAGVASSVEAIKQSGGAVG